MSDEKPKNTHYEVEKLCPDRVWHLHQTATSLAEARALTESLAEARQGYRMRIVHATKSVSIVEFWIPLKDGCYRAIFTDCPDELSGISGPLGAQFDAAQLLDDVQELRAENDKLRRLLAESPADCPYCKLPRERMGECVHGFPGCPRADDMCLDGGPTMTPEMEAALEASNAKCRQCPACDGDGQITPPRDRNGNIDWISGEPTGPDIMCPECEGEGWFEDDDSSFDEIDK